MDANTRVLGSFEGYTLEDCECRLCLYYPGKGKPCPLDECCCAEEKRLALERERRPATTICPA